MKIDKAIKSLQRDSFAVDSLGDPELRDAMKLGIEALMVIQLARVEHSIVIARQLPSETED